MWRTVLYSMARFSPRADLPWQRLEFQMLARTHPLEIYLAILAASLSRRSAGGLALRSRSSRHRRRKKFEINHRGTAEPGT